MSTRRLSCFVSWTVALMMVGSAAAQTSAPASANPTATQPARVEPDASPVLAPGSTVKHDIPYVPGGGPQQMLDVYAPPRVKAAPVVIFVHGGEWAKRDKREVSCKPKFFNEQGVVFASVNYRLSGTAQHPAQVNDVAAACRWLRDHVVEFGGDPHLLFLMGHSAGCHIVTLVGLDPRPLASVAMKPSDLRGVVSWSGGAFDLVAKVAEQGMYADYIRKNFGETEQVWRDASPMNHVGNARSAPAFLFVSADGDKLASLEANARMTALVRKHGGQAERVILQGKTHQTANHELGMPGDATGASLMQFIRRCVTGPPQS